MRVFSAKCAGYTEGDEAFCVVTVGVGRGDSAKCAGYTEGDEAFCVVLSFWLWKMKRSVVHRIYRESRCARWRDQGADR